jgi:hypothetical protein
MKRESVALPIPDLLYRDAGTINEEIAKKSGFSKVLILLILKH